MKVLITGAQGQVGRALLRSAPVGAVCTALNRQALDITDGAALSRCIEVMQPAVVINAAAYTAVDRAEAEVEQAFLVNARAPRVIAEACRNQRSRLIHISTDFVFDGSVGQPYQTNDIPRPLSVYGASKLEGEHEIAGVSGLDYRIVRTAWVYASEGRNFLLTMLRLFRERARVCVVADQTGTPTSAASVANCIWTAAADDGPPAILHFTDAGVASWYDFAVAIYEEACAIGLIKTAVDIVPITTGEYPTPARRPSYSVLDKTSTWRRLKLTPVHWRAALRQVLAEIPS